MRKKTPEQEPGIIDFEYIDEGRTALLDIRQVGGEILKFTVPTKPLVSNSAPETTAQTTDLE